MKNKSQFGNIIIFLMIIYFILSFINPVKADTSIINDNTTSIMNYTNQTVDTHYYLNYTDSLTYFKLNYNLFRTTSPYTITYEFKDKRNNTLIISDLYSYNNYFGVLPYISRTRTVYLNNIPQKFIPPTLLGGNYSKLGYDTTYNYSENFYLVDYLSDTSSFDDRFTFSTNEVLFDKPLLGSNAYRIVFNTNLFINEFIIPNSTKIEYTNIYLEYQDNSIAFINIEIDKAYDSMNPVFKFIFIFFKGIVSFMGWLNVINDSQMYEYQYYFISPLSYIDYAIKLFFSTLKFISTMGLLWVFLIIESIIFIVNWIKTGDILDTITNSLSDTKSIWEVLLIRPLNWIYTKLMLFWTSK